MSPPQPRQVSGESAASRDTISSEDAWLARRAETLLLQGLEDLSSDDGEDVGDNEDEDDDETTSEEDESEREDSEDDTNSGPSSEVAAHIDTLRRSLSVQSKITTTSSFAERMEKAKLTPNAPYVVIGRGSAGTVFEIPGTEFALKKGSVKESIWADSQMTNMAYNAVIDCKAALENDFPGISVPRVPRVLEWVKDEDMGEWWEKNGSRFVNVIDGIDDSKRGHLFCTQRILPLPQPAREALIKSYFPSNEIEFALANPENKAGLIRLYLGQRRSFRELDQPQLTLENYPLYLDQILQIKLDIKQYTKEMAVGLAIVHWAAQLDGMDMEFVIGSAASTGELAVVMPDWRAQTPLVASAGDFRRRSIHLWMLDYDKAKQIDTSKSWKTSCAQMVTAVTANDPYFPNPVKIGEVERQIWTIFEAAYIKAAQMMILKDWRVDFKERRAMTKLPKQFLKQWKKVAQEQADNEGGGFVQFG